MKRLFASLTLLFAATALMAQTAQPAPPPAPKSPAAEAKAMVAGKSISVTYNAPRVNGREGKLFSADGKISHDPTFPIWRAGANKATQLHTDADLQVGGAAGFILPKGDYSLYVDLSNPHLWTLVINKKIGQWGTEYDKSADAGRIGLTMAKPATLVEELSYTITETKPGHATLTLAWENFSASVELAAR